MMRLPWVNFLPCMLTPNTRPEQDNKYKDRQRQFSHSCHLCLDIKYFPATGVSLEVSEDEAGQVGGVGVQDGGEVWPETVREAQEEDGVAPVLHYQQPLCHGDVLREEECQINCAECLLSPYLDVKIVMDDPHWIRRLHPPQSHRGVLTAGENDSSGQDNVRHLAEREQKYHQNQSQLLSQLRLENIAS